MIKRYLLLILFILFEYTLFFLLITSIRPMQVVMADDTGKRQYITLPQIKDSNQNIKKYTFTGNIYIPLITQHIVNITADDCIEYVRINNVPVDLSKLVKGDVCSWSKGIDIDLSKYLKYGKNTFEIGIIDHGGRFVLSIKNSYYDKLYFMSLILLIIEVTILLYFLLKRCLHLHNALIIVLLLGLLIRIIYLSYTPFTSREHDVLEWGGHLYYVQYVGDNLRLPEIKNGWEFYQPPFYYITAAMIYCLSNVLSFNYPILLQILSLSCSFVFLTIGALIFKIIKTNKFALFTSTSLLAFWPSGIIDSIWIGNDPMYYMFTAIDLFLLIKWVTERQNKFFYLFTLFLALTLLTKMNGLLFVVLFICLIIVLFFKNCIRVVSYRKALLKGLFIISILLFSLFGSIYRTLPAYSPNSNINIFKFLVPNASTMNRQLLVHNNLINYIYFDANIFLTQAFTNSWSDIGGRQFFWNYFLKSMLFGEFNFAPLIQVVLAKTLSWLMLAMLTFFFVGFIYLFKKFNFSYLVLLLYFSISLVTLINYHHSLPYAPDADFRLIFPVIIPSIYFYLLGINFFMENKLKIVGIIGYILIYFFVIASNLFFVFPLLNKIS